MQDTEWCSLQEIKGSFQDNGDYDELRLTFLIVILCIACSKLQRADTKSCSKLFLSQYAYFQLKLQ